MLALSKERDDAPVRACVSPCELSHQYALPIALSLALGACSQSVPNCDVAHDAANDVLTEREAGGDAALESGPIVGASPCANASEYYTVQYELLTPQHRGQCIPSYFANSYPVRCTIDEIEPLGVACADLAGRTPLLGADGAPVTYTREPGEVRAVCRVRQTHELATEGWYVRTEVTPGGCTIALMYTDTDPALVGTLVNVRCCL